MGRAMDTTLGRSTPEESSSLLWQPDALCLLPAPFQALTLSGLVMSQPQLHLVIGVARPRAVFFPERDLHCGWQRGPWSYGQNTQTDSFTRGYVSAIICSLSCFPPYDDPYSPSTGPHIMEAESRMDWKILLAYITGSVDQELLLRNEYLVTENRLLRTQIKGRIRPSDGERKTLAEIGKKLGKQALKEVASIVSPDTILAWHRKLVAQKFDGSQQRK